jgi:polar amino acid transport system substrate-binding protein
MKRYSLIALLYSAVAGGIMPAQAQQLAQADQRVGDLVTTGQFRIGVFPSFQYSKDTVTGEPRGLAIGIARALAKRLGLRDVITIAYPTPTEVMECVKTGRCDAGFMLIDPTRTSELDFTPAFVRSDFTYMLPAGSTVRSSAEIDRTGYRIATVRGHASTAALVRIIKQAHPVYVDTYEAAVELLRAGNADAFASIRENLLQYSIQIPGSRVLNDSYQSNLAGIALPKGNAGRLAYISEFLDDMKRNGSLQQLINDAGLRGIDIVAP